MKKAHCLPAVSGIHCKRLIFPMDDSEIKEGDIIESGAIKELFFGDYDRKTITFSSGSFLVSVVFAIYNGYLGAHYQSLWYGSICVYYLLLSVLRAILIISNLRLAGKDRDLSKKKRRIIFLLTNAILLLLNLSLIVPISLMARMMKPVEMTLIPSIAMATYTTYKIIIASFNMKKRKTTDNILVKELRTINFIDALLSIIVLQNTLIMVNSGGGNREMMIVSAASSSVILILMITVSVLGFVKDSKQLSQKGLRQIQSLTEQTDAAIPEENHDKH